MAARKAEPPIRECRPPVGLSPGITTAERKTDKETDRQTDRQADTLSVSTLGCRSVFQLLLIAASTARHQHLDRMQTNQPKNPASVTHPYVMSDREMTHE